jgi:hypothetical protein
MQSLNFLKFGGISHWNPPLQHLVKIRINYFYSGFVQIRTSGATCHVLFAVNQRNWFRIFQLLTIMVIGLQKPYTKTEVIAGLVMYDVY